MPTSFQYIRKSLLARIHAGEWKLGELIPGEVKIAEEYGCSRTTVNRAIRKLAEEGIVVRKRKAGTRIRQYPLREAKFNIPLVRSEVEAVGAIYGFKLKAQKLVVPPAPIRKRLRLSGHDKVFYTETLHLAGDHPYAFETRWLNLKAVPEIKSVSLNEISLNEWLVQSVPFSQGDVAFSAVNANLEMAETLGVQEGAALFVVDRTTWQNEDFITTLKLYYKDGYKLSSKI